MRTGKRKIFILIFVGAGLLLPWPSGLSLSFQKPKEPSNQSGTASSANKKAVDPQRKKQSSVPTPPVKVVPASPTSPTSPASTTTIVADKRLVQVGETVTFQLNPAPINSPYIYHFDYGDGSKDSMDRSRRVVQHRFITEGNFKVSLTAEAPPGVPPNEEAFDSITIRAEHVKLAPTPPSLEVGEPFSLIATSVSKDPNIQYQFSFDGKNYLPWQASNQSPVHTYSVAGPYQPTVQIGFAEKTAAPTPLDSASSDVNVTLPPANSLVLKVEPQDINADQPVTLSATFSANPNGRHFQYRFIFGDTQESSWQDSPETVHPYQAGTFEPKVEAGVLIDGAVATLVTSVPQTISVLPASHSIASPNPVVSPTPAPTPSWPPPYLFPIILVLAIVAGILITVGVVVGGYKTAKWVFTPKPTFVAHTDAGNAKMDQPPGMVPVINFELHVDPNVRAGVFGVITNEPRLIRAERIQL